MMTGRNIFSTLVALKVPSSQSYEENLQTLLKEVDAIESDAFILAPEVTVTNFDYAHFEQAAAFSSLIDTALINASKEKTIALTRIEKIEEHFYNVAKVYHKGAIVYSQAKHKLFTLGEETRYFTSSKEESIHLFEIEGIKIGILICFELRFTALWQHLLGADIILVPAQWGNIRAPHFKTLSNALAIANQCYVIACDSPNSDCTDHQAVYTPFGEQFLLQCPFNRQEITKMRRYLNTGISCG